MAKSKIREIKATVKILIPEDSPLNNATDEQLLETLRAKSTEKEIKFYSMEILED